MIWTVPFDITNSVIRIAKELNGKWVGLVNVQPETWAKEYCCHWNVETKCKADGGTLVNGYYLLYWEEIDVWQAISHSVYMNKNNELTDITPHSTGVDYHMFVLTLERSKVNNLYIKSLAKYKKQETNIMSYVYMLVDPRNDQPFYIGKGKGRRAKTHLWEIPETRNVHKENKIASIREAGLEPKIVYVAENIIDESLAYDMETSLISKYGRKGYEKNGILTNICLDSRPPNHKGKSYEEIYGPDRAILERKKRADLQLARGGYGPDQHTELTKKKISESLKKHNLEKRLSEEDILKYGAQFCKFFNGEISRKKWIWWAKINNIPVNIIKTSRFGGADILDIFCKEFNVRKKFDSMLWYHDPVTNKKFRCFDWEVDKIKIPDGYLRGRGKF